ncbi:DNA polymerase III alpha subunit [Streptomyces sp. TE3672]
MTVIGPMGFSSYFLVVADVCRHARGNKIPLGVAADVRHARGNKIPLGPGRGSATGSIVACAARITELCPLEHGHCSKAREA